MSRLGPVASRLLTTILVGGVAIGACLAALLPGTAVFAKAYSYQSNAIGKLRQLDQRSTVYDADGNVIGVLGTENRQDVRLAQVPKILQDAVISVEDHTFWTNDGIDLNGVFRAAVTNASSGQVLQGGSTITQQLVKQRILNSARTVNRKVKEIVLALRLNKEYTKSQILEQYLNTVYFGQGSYGVKSAVERFFLVPDAASPFGGVTQTQLSQVNIGQAALLAGLINNPTGDSPFSNPQGAKDRRAVALDRMVAEHYITQAQADYWNNTPLPTIVPPPDLRPTNAWVSEVESRLINDPVYSSLGRTAQERQNAVLTGGLQIYATENPTMQNQAQNVVNNDLSSPSGFTGSLVAMNPKNGEVEAMVGGPGFQSSQYNIATQYPGRQAGSTWKVITLAAALESGFSPNDQVDGTSPCSLPPWGMTQNAEPGGGVMTLRAATANSVNCAFARTQLAVGFPKLIDTAHAMGITQQTLKPVLTLTLGAIESTALEMATVASTIADEGMHHSPVFVSKIVGPAGQTIFDANTLPGQQVISKDTADCETDLLHGVITGGTGTGAALNGRDAAGKTGTTDGQTDANFLEFTGGAQIADFIWHGNPLGRVPGAGFGGNYPASASRDFLNQALQGQPALPLPDPGPACQRPGGLITPQGRIASGAVFPGAPGAGGTPQPVAPPPSIVITPPTLPITTPTTSPVTTTPST
ncbi:MAG TPA: transglycosylase domain-containing protein [Acidimicrobiia bacterium]